MSAEFAKIFQQVAANMTAVADSPYMSAVERAVDVIHDAFASGHKLLVFGNGGSAADAEHLATEFVGRFLTERRPLPAIALTANQAFLTAWGNDRSFDDVFARQVEGLGVPGDVAFGITTSGASANVLNGLRRARERGLKTIGLTGKNASQLHALCDVLLSAPVASTPRIQEVHLVTCHTICGAVEARLGRNASE